MNVVRVECLSLLETNKFDSLIGQYQGELEKVIALDSYLVGYIGEGILADKGHLVFGDPVITKMLLKNDVYEFSQSPRYIFTVGMRPGVTDNPGHTAASALSLIDPNGHYRVSSGKTYLLFGDRLKKETAEKIGGHFFNNLIETGIIFEGSEWKTKSRFEKPHFPDVVLKHENNVEKIDLNISDERLLTLNKEKCLALTLDELHFIRDSHQNNLVRGKRIPELGEALTDVELEVIAQSWSEHCKHKIFSANISYEENLSEGEASLKDIKKIEGLYSKTIKQTTKEIKEKRKLDWLISVFSDNAGIVRYDDNLDVCIKVETHNSPSALDPYGGALTGILGVNRDILGTGLGAKPIANLDVFCFAPPTMPFENEEVMMPARLMNPKRLLEGVHKGVEDGGNKSGIPTVTGAIHFDEDYAGKPLVYVGTVGVLPQKLKSGLATSGKYTQVGDHIFMVGGAIGADGIHGATMSSLELDENSPATAVQIGDPLTQKLMTDFILEARDLELYSALTDNGAGGLSSSIGEMATQTNGAKIDLALAHVKYPGLTPYELMISESQERMSVAVPSAKVEAFKKLAKKYSVQISDIGEFTNSGVLEVYYDKKIVAHLNLHFLHEALPKMNLKARYQSFGLLKERSSWRKDLKELYNPQTDSRVTKTKKKFSLDDLEETIQTLLASPNIKSKEELVRHYDHEVGASTLVKPFVGENGRAPSDGAVVWLHPHGGASDSAITVGIGMAPRLSLIDPYIMAQYSLDEAVRNIVASGADPEMVSLLDNFCWPDPVVSEKNPDGEMKLGALVRSCYGMRELCLSYGMPLISGKDSMKNDYRGPNKKGEERVISVLPTLLITALGKADANHLTQTAINNDEQYLYILGPKLLRQSRSLLGSEFFEFFSLSNDDLKNEKMPLPIADEANCYLELYKSIFEARKTKLFSTLHDISDGGAVIALVEKVIGVNRGLDLDFSYAADDELARELFNEAPGRFIVSVSKTKKDQFEGYFRKHDLKLVGETSKNLNVTLKCQNRTFNMNKASFESAFGGGF